MTDYAKGSTIWKLTEFAELGWIAKFIIIVSGRWLNVFNAFVQITRSLIFLHGGQELLHFLIELGIRHKLIRPFTPRHNGKVERSHHKDNEEFYAVHKFFSFSDLQKQLAVWQRQYNAFPMPPLAWRSPSQVLSDFVTHL